MKLSSPIPRGLTFPIILLALAFAPTESALENQQSQETAALRSAAHLLPLDSMRGKSLQECYPTVIRTQDSARLGFFPYYWPTLDSKRPQLPLPNALDSDEKLNITRLYFCIEDLVPVPDDRWHTPRKVNLWVPAKKDSSEFSPFCLATSKRLDSGNTVATPAKYLPDGAYCLHTGNLDPNAPLPKHCYPFMIRGFGIPEIAEMEFPTDDDGRLMNLRVKNSGKGQFRDGFLTAVLSKEDGSFIERLNSNVPAIMAESSTVLEVDFRHIDFEPGKYFIHGHVNYKWLFDPNPLTKFRTEVFTAPN